MVVPASSDFGLTFDGAARSRLAINGQWQKPKNRKF
jgi:hypothetical protein